MRSFERSDVFELWSILLKIKNISDILKCFLNDTSKKVDIIDRLEKPEILSN